MSGPNKNVHLRFAASQQYKATLAGFKLVAWDKSPLRATISCIIAGRNLDPTFHSPSAEFAMSKLHLMR